MELDYKQILGAITVLMIIIGYGKYMIDTWKGNTKPHLYTWVTFLITATIAFFVQYNDGAGPGAWAVGAGAITNCVICVLAIRQGETNITKTDTVSFILGLCSIAAYILIPNPVYSLILTMVIIIFAFYPTFRKSFYKPQEETLLIYIFAAVRSLISIFAIYHFSFLTLAYPVFLAIINILFVFLVLIRKKQLGIQ